MSVGLHSPIFTLRVCRSVKALKPNPKTRQGKIAFSVQLRAQQGTAERVGESFLDKNIGEMAD